MVDGIGTTTNSYWPGGRLNSKAGPWTAATVSWGYANTVPGRRASLTLQQPSGPWSQTYTWHKVGRLTNLVSDNRTPTAFTVNSENELTSGPDSACTWDANGRIRFPSRFHAVPAARIN
ncbi:MAG: hypothetical protein H7A47_09945 [Verrucomicrobiales bacterium]|nr:hypothetical protein [Verrucomicrobiales bacterium]